MNDQVPSGEHWLEIQFPLETGLLPLEGVIEEDEFDFERMPLSAVQRFESDEAIFVVRFSSN